MDKYPRFKQYMRTSPWSIIANGRTYSIDPWCFESANIKILDVRLETWGPNKWGWPEDRICQIKGKAKFPDLGFVGGEERPDKLLKMGEYLIYPIDDDSIEKEFQEGLLHYKAALGDFRDEFDQLSQIEIAEKFGNPHNYGVCRIRGSQWSDGFIRIFVGSDIFEKISSGIAKVGVSEINIRFRLWNAFYDNETYPKRLFLHNEAQDGNYYINDGIIDEICVDYSYNRILTDHGFDFENERLDELNKVVNLLTSESILEKYALDKIYMGVKFTVILILTLIILLMFSIWR